MTLDDMFCREFIKMMNDRKANYGVMPLPDIPVPKKFLDFNISTRDSCIVTGISDEYYSKLNNTEPRLWGTGKLNRRKFDYQGKFMHDKETGSYLLEEVPVPRDSVAIISDIRLGVPNKYKPNEEGFAYVDYVTNKKEQKVYYVYLVPRRYCYKLNETALILSYNKHRLYYKGISLALQNGSYIYIYVIPFKPTTSVKRNYRILCTKSSVDYTDELKELQYYWAKRNMIFNPDLCVTEGYKGRENMSYEEFPVLIDDYIRFDMDKSMSKDEDDLSDFDTEVI